MSEISLKTIKSDSEEAEIKIEMTFAYSKLRNDAEEIKAAFEELMNQYAI